MPKKEVSKTVVWRCPICTYDNEDSMSECDICGVLRNPLVKTNIKTDNVAGITACPFTSLSIFCIVISIFQIFFCLFNFPVNSLLFIESQAIRAIGLPYGLYLFPFLYPMPLNCIKVIIEIYSQK